MRSLRAYLHTLYYCLNPDDEWACPGKVQQVLGEVGMVERYLGFVATYLQFKSVSQNLTGRVTIRNELNRL